MMKGENLERHYAAEDIFAWFYSEYTKGLTLEGARNHAMKASSEPGIKESRVLDLSRRLFRKKLETWENGKKV